jgi:hypothetical protein
VFITLVERTCRRSLKSRTVDHRNPSVDERPGETE